MRLKKLLDDGALGEIKRVQLENSRYFRTWMYHRSGSWRSSWAGEGGGALLNQGQHILDIWQWLFGMPTSIYAVIPYGKYNDFMVDDEATLLMEYPQQRTATFILSTGEGSYTERLEIVGTKGTALLEKDTLTLHTYTPDTETYRRTADCTERQQLTVTTVTEQFAPQAEPYPEMLAKLCGCHFARHAPDRPRRGGRAGAGTDRRGLPVRMAGGEDHPAAGRRPV